MDTQTNFLDRLFDAGLLIDTGVEGLMAAAASSKRSLLPSNG